MITATKAYEALVRAGFANSFKKAKIKVGKYDETHFEIDSNNFRSSNETYGKKSFLYFKCESHDITQKMYDLLKSIGGDPDFKWNGGLRNKSFEMRVGFFKGSRWWE